MSPPIDREFLEQGACTVNTPLLPSQIAAASAALDRLLSFREQPGERPRHRVGLTCSFLEPCLVEILQEPFLEEVSREVLRAERVRFFQTAIVTAYPQPDTPFSFDQHVDIQYRLSDFQAVPRRVICSFFLWLTDVNERRAPMMFRPGSHLLLAEHHEQRGSGPEEVGVVRGVPLSGLPALEYADPVPLLARAGQASVLTTSAVHGASVNVDDSPRKGMVITFVAEGVEIGLPAEQAEQTRQYHEALRPLFRPDRRHILDVCATPAHAPA